LGREEEKAGSPSRQKRRSDDDESERRGATATAVAAPQTAPRFKSLVRATKRSSPSLPPHPLPLLDLVLLNLYPHTTKVLLFS
jgi:hypothetical protein